MAVYHLECRIAADGKPNPPARVAKYHGNCALPSCSRPIVKGEPISCTRDNENGQRKGAGAKGAPDFRDDKGIARPDERARDFANMAHLINRMAEDELPFPEGPITDRAPALFPSVTDDMQSVPRENIDAARTVIEAYETLVAGKSFRIAVLESDLAKSRAAHEKTLHDLANALHTLAAIRHAMNQQEQK